MTPDATVLPAAPRIGGGVAWRVCVEPDGRAGSENMAVDESLLREADRTGVAFLRLYRWDPPCLSFGRNEPALTRYHRSAIAHLGLDVVRRPTGGRAVWHEHEVTYAVAAPVEMFGSLRESYRLIHARLAAALRQLGVPAELASDGRTLGPVDGPPSCFAAAVGGEITVGGKKVVGSAQVRLGRAFLQHGSILLDGTQDVVSAVSKQPSAVSGSTTLSKVLGRPVSFAEVAEAVVSAWGASTSTPLARPRPRPTGSPSGSSPARFFDPSWTWRR